MADNEGPMQVNVDLVRALAELLDQTSLTEVEVEHGDRRIRVARKAPQAAATQVALPMAAPPIAAAAAPAPAAPAESVAPAAEAGTPVKSPMVGTAYLASAPGAKPFITVGETVAEGQTVLIIEAMKVMNQIAAPKSGRVARIAIENGQPVEYDQTLLVIE